jgi:4-hydroxy-tetrahydrodipicolinate synthase
MTEMKWTGVMPAITTPFDGQFQVDYGFLARHAKWLVENGCTGIVALGSLGEGATLAYEEKGEILRTLVDAVGSSVPVVAGISALSTTEAVRLAKDSETLGCHGLMVLPPYVYAGDWREMKAHVSAIIEATGLSCMLYNNPPAYATDFTPPRVAELAREQEALHAVKESSTDLRRITGIRALLDDRLAIFAGIDDMVIEGIHEGAVGWIAGLVNALPRESVDLFELGKAGEKEKAFELYRWFLPLLRLDDGPQFVQLIKLAQQEAGVGTETVRPPRMTIEGDRRGEVVALIRGCLAERPASSSTKF